MKFRCFLWVLCSLLLFSTASPAQEALWRSSAEDGSPRVHLYFFWSAQCPHCQNARAWLQPNMEQYDWLILHSYNILEDRRYVERYAKMAASMGRDASSVPAFFVCGQMQVGWDAQNAMGKQLLTLAERCRYSADEQLDVDKELSLQLPLLGSVDARTVSLPLFTLIIAAMDAFNPCAFFVLLFLLSMLIHARSRARMLLIGGSFVLVSGVAYFIFMAAWLNLFLLTGSLPWITMAAGLLAIVIGLFGIKDFLFSLRGPSLSLPDAAKSRLFNRMRGLLSTDSLPMLLLATFTLALAANSYELLCTAGFPMVYTRALTLHELDATTYYLYLALYNIVYVIPLAIIVLLFTRTLGARKLTLTEGRLLKLLSGIMMFGLGLILFIRPELLGSVFTGLALLFAALMITVGAAWYLRKTEKE